MLKKISIFSVGVMALSCAPTSEKTTSERPNILLVMADDMGYSDLGFMGSGIQTPNIDRLANNGVVFSQAYNTGRCCPTRASLMTGLYAHQTGMGWMTASNLGSPGYTGDLNKQCVTMAQVLKQADYACYMTGKWHLTYDPFMEADGPKHNWPLQRGFDRFYGHLTGGGSYFTTETMTYGNDRVALPDDFYLTQAVTDSTVSFLNHHYETQKEKPFFTYVAYYAPHRPLHALQGDIAKYRGQFIDGWDKNREQRFERLKALGIVNENWELTERDANVREWNSLTEEGKQVWDARMAVYAAQIDRMDQGIGQIIQTLQDNGELDNTLIIFLSDNGGCAEYQGGNLTLEDLPQLGNEHPAESYRTNWANVSNTPFREYKSFVHQGGISTPLIMHWPDQIKAKGTITKQVAHVIDLMPTLAELAGADYPKSVEGSAIHPLPGKSLVPAMNGDVFGRKPLFFEHEANCAVIDCNWKLVRKGKPQPPYEGTWELYDLAVDPTEMYDLIDEQPQKANEMQQLWEKWAKENQVYPLDGRGWGVRVKSDLGAPAIN